MTVPDDGVSRQGPGAAQQVSMMPAAINWRDLKTGIIREVCRINCRSSLHYVTLFHYLIHYVVISSTVYLIYRLSIYRFQQSRTPQWSAAVSGFYFVVLVYNKSARFGTWYNYEFYISRNCLSKFWKLYGKSILATDSLVRVCALFEQPWCLKATRLSTEIVFFPSLFSTSRSFNMRIMCTHVPSFQRFKLCLVICW